MDLVYFGSGAFGLPTLKALARLHRVRAIVTQPDRPAGRQGVLTATPIAQWAAANLPDAPIYKPERLNHDPAMLAELRALPADTFVVIAFGQKLGSSLLDERFAINLHGSLLPRWRGAAPINAALLAGDVIVGNSVITLADRMDAGLILAQSSHDLSHVPPSPSARPWPLNAGEVHDLLAEDGPDLILKVLDDHGAGRLAPRSQDESLVTLAPKLSRADDWLDFTQGAEACCRRILGLSPWPGITVRFRGQSLKLLRAEQGSDSAAASRSALIEGSIVDPESGLVSCGPGPLLRILDVHPAGKRPMLWRDFARGQRMVAGERIEPWRQHGAKHA